eukprot:m.182610 g.182610  ORF g.182610 m.182610 type:complete len:233 (+) comp24646_c0_seq2:1168-1866(+)
MLQVGTSPRLVGMKFSCTPVGSHSRTVGTTESICGQTILEFVCFGFERMASPRSPHRTARTPRWNNSRRCSPELFWCLQGVHPGTSPRTRRPCPASAPPVTCKTDADCTAVMPSDPKLTCRGVPVTCLSGVCGSKLGGDLCVGKEYTGGVTLGLNVETSVAGFALVEVQQHGVNVSGMSLSDAVPIRGSALSAAPSWKSGASLTTLAGTEITLKIALTDARLFAVRIGCSSQ